MNEYTRTQALAAAARERIDAGDYDTPEVIDATVDRMAQAIAPHPDDDDDQARSRRHLGRIAAGYYRGPSPAAVSASR